MGVTAWLGQHRLSTDGRPFERIVISGVHDHTRPGASEAGVQSMSVGGYRLPMAAGGMARRFDDGDGVSIVLQGLMGAVPLVGSGMSAAVAEANRIRRDRIAERRAQLAQELRRCVDQALLVDRLCTDEAFQNRFIDAVQAAERTRSLAKRRAIARAVATIVRDGDDAEVSTEAFALHAFGRLDVAHFVGLHDLKVACDGLPEKTAGVSKDALSSLVTPVRAELVALGAAEENWGLGGMFVRITDFGLDLLRRLTEAT